MHLDFHKDDSETSLQASLLMIQNGTPSGDQTNPN